MDIRITAEPDEGVKDTYAFFVGRDRRNIVLLADALVLVGGGSVAVGAIGSVSPGLIVAGCYFVGLGLYYLLFQPRRVVQRLIALRSTDKAPVASNIAITERCLTIENRYERSETSWYVFTGVVERPTIFLLMVNRSSAVAIPKRTLTAAQLDELRAFFAKVNWSAELPPVAPVPAAATA